MSTPSVAQAALDAASCGISVWPPQNNGTKAPDGQWKIGQTRRTTPEQIAAWYATGRTGVGWITGAVSGNLEVLDLDDRSVWAEYQRLAADAGLGPLLERVMAGCLEHSPNGAHLFYRCSTIEPNQKLAKRPDGTGWSKK
jgi:putative DNA primase/helicase